jgi:small subunit ribosomal protein S6
LSATLDEIKSAFRFNDAVLRDLVIARKEAETAPSPLVKARDDRDEERPPRRDHRDDSERRPRGEEVPESVTESAPESVAVSEDAGSDTDEAPAASD